MKATLIAAILLIQISESCAQNLLPNSSFENFQNCPASSTTFGSAIAVDDWYIPINHTGTPDLFNTCATGTIVWVPDNIVGSQNALDGNGYVGLYAHRQSAAVREYLGASLTSPMQAGFTYQVVCNYSLSDDSEMAVDGFGIHFSSGPLTTNVGNQDVLSITPSYLHSTLMTERNTWESITFDYVAQGGEDYFTMGFFLDDNTMNIVSQGPYPRPDAYYYFDHVSVTKVPVSINAGPDLITCQNDPVQLTAIGDAPFWWSVLDNPTVSIGTGAEIVVNPQNTTTYIVHNNLSTDTVTVTVSLPVDLHLGADTLLCPGEELTLQNNAPGSLSLWQDGSTGDSFTVTETGTYALEITNGACITTDQIFVEVAKNREIAPDTTQCIGNSYFLDAYPFVSETNSIATTYEWMDGETDQTRIFNNTQNISVTTTNQCGSKTFSVKLLYEDCECDLYIPSAFTPNEDGINDIFKPVNACQFISYQMEILDRWGNHLFLSKRPEHGWDGGKNGFYVQSGVYNYLVTYRPVNSIEPRVLRGSVTVVR